MSKQIDAKIMLDFVWGIICKLYSEGSKLCSEGDKLYSEGSKLYSEGNKLCSEGDKLRSEGSKLCSEGNKLFFDAVFKVYGNIKIEWESNYSTENIKIACTLENGEKFNNDIIRS
jgi:hypothetical protein